MLNVFLALFHIFLTMKQKHVTNAHLTNNLILNQRNVNAQNTFLFKLQKHALHVISLTISTIQRNNANLAQKIMFIILMKIIVGDVQNRLQF